MTNNSGFQLSAVKGLSNVGVVPAWQQLGAEVNALTWEEAMTQANLNWTVSKEQHRSARPDANGEYPLIDAYGIYRDDTDAFLGQVGNVFTPIQNIDQFKFVDSL